jgi:heme-degrading monooxygenase HmoA
MIARLWRGLTAQTKSVAYLEYLRKTGERECRATTGNRGVFILRREIDGKAEFLFLSLWESMESIRAFAGPDLEKAVYYPEDAEFLLEMEPGVAHYEVPVSPEEP